MRIILITIIVMKTILHRLAPAVAALALLPAAAQDKVLNLYTSRHYQTDEALYDNFTKATGIKINRIEAGEDALIERIRNEGARSPADVMITVDAGRLWRAEQLGLFQPVKSKLLESRIPANLREPGGHWFGFSQRARVIAYNKAKVQASELPTYESLAEPKGIAIDLIAQPDLPPATVDADKVREILKVSQEPVSLETPIGEEEDSHLGDFIEDSDAVVPVDAASFILLQEQLESVLHTLSEREKKVIQLRFGLLDGHPRTLEEVGREFGVTRERIRQIESKTLSKLRHPSRSQKLRDYLE